MRTVAVSSAMTARPWAIVVTHSARSPSGSLYRISIAGELRVREDAGLPHVRLHDLRHAYGTWLAESGVPLTDVRDLMGHSSLAVTSRYAHSHVDRLRKATASLPILHGAEMGPDGTLQRA